MDVSLAVLADYANISTDGKLNVMGIFDSISAYSFPTVLLQMRLVVKFRFNLAEHGTTRLAKFVLMDADGHEIGSLGQTMQVPQEGSLNPEVALLVDFRGIPFAAPGDYQIEVLVDNDHKYTLPLHAVLLPSQPEG